jgi:hypothetical protein
VGSQTLAAEIQQRCFDHGLVIETSGPNDHIVKVFPALTTPVDILERGRDILQDSVEASVLSVSSKLGWRMATAWVSPTRLNLNATLTSRHAKRATPTSTVRMPAEWLPPRWRPDRRK